MEGIIKKNINNTVFHISVSKNTVYSTMLDSLRKTIVDEDEQTITFKATMEIKSSCGEARENYFIGFNPSLTIVGGATEIEHCASHPI